MSLFLIYIGIGMSLYILYKILVPSKIEYKHTYTHPQPSTTLPEYEKGKYYCTKPWEEKPIPLAQEGVASWKPETVFEVFEKGVSMMPNSKFIAKEYPDANDNNKLKWKIITRQEYFNLIKNVARSLIALKTKKWQSVCIMGFNSPEWASSYFGAIYAGLLGVGIYQTNNPKQCEYILQDSNCSVLILENSRQLDKFVDISETCNNKLLSIVIWDDDRKMDYSQAFSIPIYNWKQFLELGNTNVKVYDNDMGNRIINIKPGMCCSLIYTSGTTGPPKGVMISHDNITWAVKCLLNTMNDTNFGYGSKHDLISYLPLSHIAAQMIDLHAPLGICCLGGDGIVWFARNDALKGSLNKTLVDVNPTIFFGVPRVWEKIEEKMKLIGQKGILLQRIIGTYAKQVGLTQFTNKQLNGNKQIPLLWPLIQSTIFKIIYNKLGFTRLKFAATGAAPIKKSTINYFGSLGIDILNVFGLSETTGLVSCCKNYYNILGSCGVSINGCHIKINHDKNRDKPNEGEILLRGRHIMMGYLNNVIKSKLSIDEYGYFRTGDVGKIDNNGVLWITGRIKELIITKGGENVAPIPIENYIKTELSAINNCVLIGEQRKYLTMLITLKTKYEESVELNENATMIDDKCLTISDAKKSEKWKKYIDNGINKYNNDKNACVSRAQKIQYYVVLDNDFSIKGGDLTSTMKLKRTKIYEKYKKEIDSMYNK